MNREVCNPQHARQLSHIDLNTCTLVCSADVPSYIASGARLVPIMEFAYESQDILKRIHTETHNFLSKLENSLSYHTTANPIFEKIEKAFNSYIAYVNTVKEKLILKLKKPNFSSNQNLANDFCIFAEEASMANINLKKAVINNDFYEIRKCALNQTTKHMQERFNYFLQNLFSHANQPPIHSGYDVLFKTPHNDADSILNHVGISLVGFQETTFNNVLSLNDLMKKGGENLSSPTLHFARGVSPPRTFNPNDVANSPTNRFETNRLVTIDSISNIPTRVDPSVTVHKFDKDTKSFFLFSPILKKKYIIQVPPQLSTLFPNDGCFPSRYWNNNIFLSGGINQNQVMKSTFIFDFNQGRFITKSDMLIPRAYHCLEEIERSIIALGGRSTVQDTTSCELFNPGNESWEQFYPMNFPRSSAVSLSFQGSIYIIGGGITSQETPLIESIRLREQDKSLKIIEINSPRRFVFPSLCANSCEIGEGRFIIFGGFTDKNMKFTETTLTQSCIFNMNSNTIEYEFPLQSEYYTITNKSQSLNVNGEIIAIDERKKIHIFSILTNSWKVIESNFENIDFK